MKISKQNGLYIAITLLMLISSACGGILALDDSGTGDGSSYSKPAPLGSSVVQDNVEATVLGVVLGNVDDVRASLTDSSLRYASSRPPSQAWVVVSLRIRNVGNSGSLLKTYSASDFNLIDSQGDIYPVELLVETDNPLSSVMLGLPADSEVQGDIVFHLLGDDEDSVLRFAPLLVLFSNPKYLALTEP